MPSHPLPLAPQTFPHIAGGVLHEMLSQPALSSPPPLQMRQSELAVPGWICMLLQPSSAAHSTRHGCPAAQLITMLSQASFAQTTTHGLPGGHVTLGLQVDPLQRMRHAPLTHSLQACGQPASTVTLASFATSFGASAGASVPESIGSPLDPLVPLEPLDPGTLVFESAASGRPEPARISSERSDPPHASIETSAPAATKTATTGPHLTKRA